MFNVQTNVANVRKCTILHTITIYMTVTRKLPATAASNIFVVVLWPLLCWTADKATGACKQRRWLLYASACLYARSWSKTRRVGLLATHFRIALWSERVLLAIDEFYDQLLSYFRNRTAAYRYVILSSSRVTYIGALFVAGFRRWRVRKHVLFVVVEFTPIYRFSHRIRLNYSYPSTRWAAVFITVILIQSQTDKLST